MSIGKDSFELKKMFEDMDESQVLGIVKDGFAAGPTTQPTTKPTTTPTPTPAKPKPRNPALPEPGVNPKPKAEEENPDVKLFMKKRGLKETKINEGQFSWLLPDGTPIYSDHENEGTIYMLDDKGNRWEENSYEGYGVFGGKDYFDLVAEMNGVSEVPGLPPKEKDKKLFQGADDIEMQRRQELRAIGIDMYYDETNSNRNLNTKVPRFTNNMSDTYDMLPDPEDDPNQGWYQETEEEQWDDDDDDEWDGEEGEGIINNGYLQPRV